MVWTRLFDTVPTNPSREEAADILFGRNAGAPPAVATLVAFHHPHEPTHSSEHLSSHRGAPPHLFCLSHRPQPGICSLLCVGNLLRLAEESWNTATLDPDVGSVEAILVVPYHIPQRMIADRHDRTPITFASNAAAAHSSAMCTTEGRVAPQNILQ